MVVAIPARDEAAHIDACLCALAQQVDGDGVSRSRTARSSDPGRGDIALGATSPVILVSPWGKWSSVWSSDRIPLPKGRLLAPCLPIIGDGDASGEIVSD